MKKTIILTIAALMTFGVTTAAAINIEENPSTVTENRPEKKKKAKGEVKEVVFHVHLHCNNCVKKVQENIAFEKGVKDLKVSLDDQTVAVKYDASKTSEEALKAAIAKLGYEVSGKVSPERVECAEDCDGHHEGHHHDHK